MEIEKEEKTGKIIEEEEELPLLEEEEKENEQNSENENENEENEISNEFLNEKIDNIMEKIQQLDIEKEIGEKEKNSGTRIIIDKIILENFKSYAGKKIIGPLHYRFNSVVGPNGSGKSNLMESLLFVFGKRAKRMRLNKLSELIHNSSSIKELRNAKVSIYFREIKEDDENNFHYIEGGDFIMTREVYKNSSSKYLLNGKESSFEEINKKLSRKGIDLKHNRFLILQGEVEQISLMKQKAQNPNETGLLEFLEDIIGTKRYINLIEKLNKAIDDLGEIKSTKVNRVRIAKNELNQLEDIKNQSTDYYNKEKQLLILKHLELLIQQYLNNIELKKKKNEIENLEKEFDKVKDEQKEKMRSMADFAMKVKEFRKEQEKIKKEKNEFEKQADKLNEEDQIKRSEMENFSKQIKKIEIQLQKLNKNYQSQNENILQAKEQNPKIEKECEDLKKEFNELDNKLNQVEKEIFSSTESLQKTKKEIENKLQPSELKINSNQFTIEQNTSTINLLSEKTKNISDQKKTLSEKLEKFKKENQEKKNIISTLQKTKEKLEKTKKEQQTLKLEKSKKAEEKGKEVQILLSRLSEVKNVNQEYNIKNKILQSLLKAQDEGKLKGIYGRLGDLGTIDKKFDIAITTSCPHLDSIIVEDVESAQRSLDYLKKNQIGQATFIILEKIKWVTQNIHLNNNIPNGCYRLFDLVKYDNPKLKNAFLFALRDTLAADDIKIAMKVAYGEIRRRVVTLNGEVIEVSGTMSGGGKAKKGGMSSEKKINESDLKDLTEKYNFKLNEYNLLKNEFNNVENAFNQTDSELNEVINQIMKIENEKEQIVKVVNECEFGINNLVNDEKKIEGQIKKINELNNQNDVLEKENEKLKNETKGLRKDLEEINSKINSLMGEEYNKKKENHKQLKKKIEELEKEISNNNNILQNANEILKKITNEIKLKEEAKIDYENKINEGDKILKEFEDKALAILGEIDKCENKINSLEEELTKGSSEIEKMRDLVAQLKQAQESKINAIKEVNEDVKRINKILNQGNEKISINKSSFNQLINDFGFIEDFEEEINEINNKDYNQKEEKKENKNQNSENKNLNSNSKEENKKEEDIEMSDSNIKENSNSENENLEINTSNFSNQKKLKLHSSDKLYTKYYSQKKLPESLSESELSILNSQSKDITYTYTMIQTKLNDMKPNMQAITQYKKTLILLKERENDLNQTNEKLKKANEVYSNVKMRRYNEFMEGFNIISKKLQEMYRLLTNGGDAELELVDTLDPFNEGISFSVRPYKKSWKVITNLSGGEKTLSSLSLIFALHHYKPSPLYVMDEIDAALDFRNVSIIANYIKEQTKDSQFIIISLRNHMFELANKLVGIYKTFDITKCIVFDPNSYDVKGNSVKKDFSGKKNKKKLYRIEEETEEVSTSKKKSIRSDKENEMND